MNPHTSATYPNTEADRCRHVFKYSIVPHIGDYRAAGIVQMAYDFNEPMTSLSIEKQQGILPEHYSLVTISEPNVLIETVKKAEDSDSVVLRLYEAYHKQTNATVTFNFAPKRATLCDLMENEILELALDENSITLSIAPFEIVTIKIEQ